MIRRNRDVSRPNFNQSNPKCANRRASYLKTNLARALRAMAPALFALTFASVAHAQGTMDFSGAQTLMGTFKQLSHYVVLTDGSRGVRLSDHTEHIPLETGRLSPWKIHFGTNEEFHRFVSFGLTAGGDR